MIDMPGWMLVALVGAASLYLGGRAVDHHVVRPISHHIVCPIFHHGCPKPAPQPNKENTNGKK